MEKVENSTFFGVVDEISCEYQPNGKEVQIPEYNAKKQILKALRDSIIGSYGRFTGPYGDRPIIYADWTASENVSRKWKIIWHSMSSLSTVTHTQVHQSLGIKRVLFDMKPEK